MRRARPASRRAGTAALLAALLPVALAACGSGGGAGLVLDGRPRHPDAEGVVEALAEDFGSITLDGGRTYALSDEVRSFSTYDLGPVPLRQRVGQYVQVGLDGDVVEWVAGIAAPVEVDGRTIVFYVGPLETVDDGAAVFEDGTVLRLGDGVAVPERGVVLQAEIDPVRRLVTALVPA